MISYNPAITDINHMTKLKILDISGSCGVGDSGIKNIYNLITLDASYNPKITNIDHMTKLRILDIRGNCGVTHCVIDGITIRY